MSGGDEEATPAETASVGYGRPPVANRFKPGKSGNPRGRPRKPKITVETVQSVTGSLAADLVLLDEAYRPIELREGGEPTTLSTVSAVYRAMAVAAVKGNRFAQRTFTERVQQAEARRREQALEVIDIASKFKERWSAAIRDAERRGAPPPEVLPHPDDILADRDGLPYIVGPADEREARHWAKLQARAAQADAAITGHLIDLKTRSGRKQEAELFNRIVFEHRIRVILRYGAPDPDTRRALYYRRPSEADKLIFAHETNAKYLEHAALSEHERMMFIWEMERYQRSDIAA